MEKQIYNFAQGPTMLPREVLEQVQNELLSYNGTGVSILELSPKSPAFLEIIARTEKLFRELIHIPENYEVLFLPGSNIDQHSMVPMNLLSENRKADYIISDHTSKNAAKEASRYGDVYIAASSAGSLPIYSVVPETKRSDFRPDCDYVHFCYNSPTFGTKFHYIPDTGNIPLVADMTSALLSEPIDISKFGLIYSSAETNLAPSGLTVVIVRSDLIGNSLEETPLNYDYAHIAEEASMHVTPPIFNIYVASLTLEWIKSLGGLEEMKRKNEKKASLIYDYLDGQFYYATAADKKCRSMTNIAFTTGSSALDEKFCVEASLAGLINLKGHESVGGMCASIYNAVDYDGVEKLVDFMRTFSRENSKING